MTQNSRALTCKNTLCKQAVSYHRLNDDVFLCLILKHKQTLFVSDSAEKLKGELLWEKERLA